MDIRIFFALLFVSMLPVASVQAADPDVKVFKLEFPQNSLGSFKTTLPQGVRAVSDSDVKVYPLAGVRQMLPVGASDPRGPMLLPSAEGRIMIDEGSRSVPYTAVDPVVTPVRILFPHGVSKLSAHDRKVVQEVAAHYKKGDPSSVIKVEGHASQRAKARNDTERQVVNLKQAMDRAFEVSSGLIRAGVPMESLQVKAWGDVRPFEETQGAIDEAANRRVEITFKDHRGGLNTGWQ